MSKLTNDKSMNMTNHRNAMLRPNFSQSKISDLTGDDIFTLNQIPNVKLNRLTHRDCSVNDLVLELSHFIDDETVNRVELSMISDRIKQQWDLPKDFQIMETRNKEIGMVQNEMEELSWRSTGTFDDQESESLENMLSTSRNQDYFDKQFYQQDMQSLYEFIDSVNRFDDRIPLLEEWIYRKEQEIQSRVVLPSKGLQKSDQELHAVVDKDLRRAREKIVAKLLPKDEFGNNSFDLEYKDLSSSDLGRIAEAVCVRLHMFNGKYPTFMPHTVQAILEHPNISKVDFDKLSTFSRMFELDWRGDRLVKNKQQFLATNPVYLNPVDKSNTLGYGDLTEEDVSTQLRQACTPFVEEVTQKMKDITSKRRE